MVEQYGLADGAHIQLICVNPQALEGWRVHLHEHTEFIVGLAGYRDIVHI